MAPVAGVTEAATPKPFHQKGRIMKRSVLNPRRSISWCACLSVLFLFVMSLVCPGLLPAKSVEETGDSLSVLPEEMATAEAEGFTFTLKILNPVSGKAQSTFYFGDEAGYEVALSIPPTAQDKKATVKLSATAKLGPVTLPFSTSHVFSGPLTNPGYKEQDNPFEPKFWKGKIKIPNDIPVSEISATVKAVFTIEGIGSTAVNKTITLKTKRKLPSPTLNYPAEGATLTPSCSGCGESSFTTYYSFSWNEVPWATKYEIAVRDKFDNAVYTHETERRSYYGYSPCIDGRHQS
jgi:hypothetical protein